MGLPFYGKYTRMDAWVPERHHHAYLRKRVLFLTGDTLGAESQAFLEQCGQPWVYKPCTAADIRTAIQQMLHAVEVAC
jgi:hypothetical protein